ncbi:hypothetical protein PghCCS26_17000 [Paenibacillus glycanilyticus]|uniref:Uncharacterized protein n=1 Tax=Paenibacillus glycanilyticus TaxID=126569 RepID=A0ABQ6NK58_9BACL|nr:hypothetical protein PghCCS26_17000 [Paenibacillus glycanilyticus]
MLIRPDGSHRVDLQAFQPSNEVKYLITTGIVVASRCEEKLLFQ